MKRHSLILVSLVWSISTSALAEELIAPYLLQTEVSVPAVSDTATAQSKITVLINLQDRSSKALRSEAFFKELISAELYRFNVTAKIQDREWIRRFAAKDLSVPDALGPKLVFDIQVTIQPDRGYESTTTVSLIEYRRKNGGAAFSPTLSWTKQQIQLAGTRQESNDNVTRSIQKALKQSRSTLLKVTDSGTFKTPDVGSSGRGEPHQGGGFASYSAKWIDPDPRRGKAFVGVSAGTPALFNLHLGYWGSKAFPFVVSLSGMYVDSRHRGAQAQVGWAFDNEGELKHGIGMNLSWLPTESTNEILHKDVIGRVSTVEKVTDVSVKPFLGGSYFVDWKRFHLQMGAAAPVSDTPDRSVRFLIQFGFVQSVGL